MNNNIKKENGKENAVKKNGNERVAVWTVGGRDHKMKLTTLTITRLENRLGTNLLNVLNEGNTKGFPARGGLPKLGTMLLILCEGMKTYDKSMTIEKACALFDKYAEEGYCQTDLAYGPFIDLYAVSGFFPKRNEEALKEAQQELLEEIRKDL
ncbi:hypothetical protein DWY36_02450 [Firmicutes bacterium AF25-13AC]|nr:hypothetical protein DWY36_02450 [Firmicutes bacterium AF25-13AC]